MFFWSDCSLVFVVWSDWIVHLYTLLFYVHRVYWASSANGFMQPHKIIKIDMNMYIHIYITYQTSWNDNSVVSFFVWVPDNSSKAWDVLMQIGFLLHLWWLPKLNNRFSIYLKAYSNNRCNSILWHNLVSLGVGKNTTLDTIELWNIQS